MSGKTPTLTSRMEQRAVIKHCVNAGMTPTDTLSFLKKDQSKPKCSRSMVFCWHRRFSNGHEDTGDLKRSGRPSGVNETDVRSVQKMLQEDRRWTVREISEMLNLKRTAVHNIVTEHLNLTKVCARWVPRLLSADEKTSRVAASNDFIRRYERQGARFLQRIITTDETYISVYEPETKASSMVWKHPSSPPPAKAKTCRSTTRQMFKFFMD